MLNIQIFDFICGESVSRVYPSSRTSTQLLQKKFVFAGTLQAEIAGCRCVEPLIYNWKAFEIFPTVKTSSLSLVSWWSNACLEVDSLLILWLLFLWSPLGSPLHIDSSNRGKKAMKSLETSALDIAVPFNSDLQPGEVRLKLIFFHWLQWTVAKGIYFYIIIKKTKQNKKTQNKQTNKTTPKSKTKSNPWGSPLVFPPPKKKKKQNPKKEFQVELSVIWVSLAFSLCVF